VENGLNVSLYSTARRKSMKRNPIILFMLVLSLIALTAEAGTTLICDTSCGANTSPTDSTLIQARAAQSAARGTVSVIRPTFSVPKTTQVIGSQSFTYSVPMFSYPGRAGMDVNLALTYNSFVWTPSGSLRALTFNADFDQPSVGFRLDYGWLVFSDDGSTGVLTDADGTKHPIGLVNVNATNEYRTIDGTDIRLVYPTGSGLGTVIAFYKTGLQVRVQSCLPAGADGGRKWQHDQHRLSKQHGYVHRHNH
jgi:hypothetical protein